MKTDVCPPGPPARTTLRPGTSLSTSGKVCSCRASISPAVMRVTLLATCDSGVGIRVAVTTTSSAATSAEAWAALARINPIIVTAIQKENDLFTASPRSNQEPKRGNAHEGLQRLQSRSHRDDSTTVAATVYPAVPSAPRLATRRRREEGLLAPGSQLAFSFPRPEASVDQCTLARRLQLRGQPRNYTAFRFFALQHLARARMIPDIRGARGRRRRS